MEIQQLLETLGQLISDEEKEQRAEELKKTRNKRVVKLEPMEETVCVEYTVGDDIHQITRGEDGLYRNQYYIKDGKARMITKGIGSLPTAVSALLKRFPNAEEKPVEEQVEE